MQGAEFRALTEFDENLLRFSKPICMCKSIMRIGTLTLYHTLEKTAIWTESLRSWNEQNMNCGAKNNNTNKMQHLTKLKKMKRKKLT